MRDALRGPDGPPAGDVTYERVWARIEDRLEGRRKRWVWRPWNHPVRWVAAALFLAAGWGGITEHRRSVERAEIASYLMTIADPAGDILEDPGILQISALLSETSPVPGRDALLTEEEPEDLMDGVGGLLL